MPYKPVNYAAIAGNAANIRGQNLQNAMLAQSMDPNSLDMQLKRARLNSMLQSPGGGKLGLEPLFAMGPEGNISAYQLSSGGGAPRKIELPENQQALTGPVNRIDVGDAIEIRDRLTNTLIQKIPKKIAPDKTPEAQAAVETAVQDVKTEKEPERAGLVEAAKVTAKAEAEAQSRTAQAAAETRLADNLGVLETIDALMTKDDSNKTLLSYAYGRENAVLPDWAKPQGWIDAESVRNRVIASLQLENVKKLKGTGPITENEQKILAQAASILANPMISPALAEKEMKRVRNMFKMWAQQSAEAVDEPMEQPNVIKWDDL